MGCGPSFCSSKKKDSVADPAQTPPPLSKEGSSRSLSKSLSFRRLDSSKSLLGKSTNESKLSYG
eukprot:166904-Rhodomonas_salina.1